MNRRDWLSLSCSSAAALAWGLACRPDQEAPAPAPARKERPPAGKAPSKATASATQAETEVVEAPQPAPSAEEKTAIAPPLKRVYLQPLGSSLPKADISYIHDSLLVFFNVEVVEALALPLPKSAYYPPRSRYRAEKLLDFLEANGPKDAHVMIGLTAVDISTTKGKYEDWGILGLATVDGGECVVSRFRAKRGAKSDMHTRERLAKTVVHEVGHTLGLLHCPNYGCIMEDGKGSVKTTDHEYDLCDECREKLGAHVKARNLEAIPWHRPQ